MQGWNGKKMGVYLQTNHLHRTENVEISLSAEL